MKGKTGKGSGGGSAIKGKLGNGIQGLGAATYSGSAGETGSVGASGPNYSGSRKRGGAVHGKKGKSRLDRKRGGCA
jgi:hypothetical protein